MGKWWQDKPLRLIQTNLREIDAGLDPARLVQSIKEFGANALLFNTGGIIANYDTKLDFHFRNPYCTDPDLVGSVANLCHKEGIRFMARFDFSKINETIAANHPGWLYKGLDGQPVNYNGQVHACVNGAYQQECSLAILDEALTRFSIDAVFFNMIGYQEHDYSGVYHGACQCDNCRKRFQELHGRAVPVKPDPDDPLWRLYAQFKLQTSSELYNKITGFIHQKGDDIGICQWSAEGVDLFRKESNSGIHRQQPEYVYVGSENILSVRSSWPDRAALNAVVHFIDFPYRHAAVPPALTMRRMAQTIATAGSPDFYVIGHLDNQDDRACLRGVKELFRFHGEHEKYYTGVLPVAGVCLILSETNNLFASHLELRGWTQVFAQAHLPFDILHENVLDGKNAVQALGKYTVVILPETRMLSASALAALDAYVKNGGNLVASGQCATFSDSRTRAARVLLESAGITRVDAVRPHIDGNYLRIGDSDKNVMNGFDDLDILPLCGELMECVSVEGCRKFLKLIPVYMYGPPEKCYYKEKLDIPGIVEHRFGNGKCIYVPWDVGHQYERFPTHAHERIMLSIIRDLLGYTPWLTTDLPPTVEIHSQARADGAWQLVSMVNLSGQNGRAVLDPVRVAPSTIRLRLARQPHSARALVARQECKIEQCAQGEFSIPVPSFDLFETVVLERSK